MSRYAIYAVIKLVLLALAWGGLNLLLPLFGRVCKGVVNNGERVGLEFFLPNWLFWFSTNTDNSLWGDEAHRIRHPNYGGYWAMVCWLYRNPCKGADWTILGAPVRDQSTIVKTQTGYRMGGYFLRVFPGNWQFGWGLDAFADGRLNMDPKATFILGR